jgi:predicted nucleic acid-binding protein
MESADESLLYLSALTLGEIRKGLAAMPHGRKRAQLEAWLEGDLYLRFSGKILAVSASIADRWGWLSADSKRKGRPLSVIDGLLAATAIEYNLTIVSRNSPDFAHLPLNLVNPWQP